MDTGKFSDDGIPVLPFEIIVNFDRAVLVEVGQGKKGFFVGEDEKILFVPFLDLPVECFPLRFPTLTVKSRFSA